MKTVDKKEKNIMDQLRDIRDKISLEIKDLTFEELKDYFDRQKGIYPKEVWKTQKLGQNK